MSEQRIANTFDKMRNTVEQYTKVVRQGGGLRKSIDELGGDSAWLDDVKDALDRLFDAIDEADRGARMHLDMQDESADLSEEPNEGNEFSGALAQAKKSGKSEFEVDGKKFKVKEAAKPDFLDMDKDGDKKEPMKKAVKDKEKVSESTDLSNLRVLAGL